MDSSKPLRSVSFRGFCEGPVDLAGFRLIFDASSPHCMIMGHADLCGRGSCHIFSE